MIKVNAEVIGKKMWKSKEKEYSLIAVTYNEKDVAGKMCSTIFTNKDYRIGEKIDCIQHQGKLYVLE